MFVTRDFGDNLADLDTLCGGCKHEASHECVEASVVVLTATLLVHGELRNVLLAVRLEDQVVAVLLVMRTFVKEMLQVRLGPAAAASLGKQAEHLRVVDCWEEFGNEAQRELRVGRRHLLVELLVQEAEVHHHVVTDDWLADLSNFLYHNTEPKLVPQHAFNLRLHVFLTRFAMEDLIVFLLKF